MCGMLSVITYQPLMFVLKLFTRLFDYHIYTRHYIFKWRKTLEVSRAEDGVKEQTRKGDANTLRQHSVQSFIAC